MPTISLNRIGSLVEVTLGTSSPDILPRNNFKFHPLANGNGVRIIVFSEGKQYLWADVTIEGVACSDYSDFKTKLATVFPEAGGSAIPTFLEFYAHVTQSGEDDPTVAEIGNQLGTINWFRISPGWFVGNSVGNLFPGLTTFCFTSTLKDVAGFIEFKRISDNQVRIETFDIDHLPADSVLDGVQINIKVYQPL